jgi:HD-GYP domain-containing protein (c-di-GMP phosphodiesterase class II)
VVVLILLRTNGHLDLAYRQPSFHMLVVSAIAAAALVVALVAARVGTRLAHAGPVWLSVGCLSVGSLMLAHGLLTPGVLDRPMNLWVGRAPYLALTLFAAGLALASRPRNAPTSRLASRYPKLVVGTVGLALAVLVAIVVSDPTRFSGSAAVPHENTLRWILAVGDAVTLALLAVTHWRRWRLGHDPVQHALLIAATMSLAAILSLRLGELWRLSWWDYHGYLLAGFGGAVYAVLVRFRQTRQVDDILAYTFERDPMAHIISGYPEALRTLVAAVEAKDPYTHGHSQRTARVAVQLGLRLGLDEDDLRAVARGGYLHDVGKIAIPDNVLHKPGPLTPEERAVIETHPRVGYDLVAPVATLAEAVPAVLHHHERWDGSGYPACLRAEEIPLTARVVAIADVWDALTSDRVYRAGLVPGVALAHLVAGRGSHFQPALVDAFVGLAADWGYVPATSPGDAEVGWQAAQTCHEVAVSRA